MESSSDFSGDSSGSMSEMDRCRDGAAAAARSIGSLATLLVDDSSGRDHAAVGSSRQRSPSDDVEARGSFEDGPVIDPELAHRKRLRHRQYVKKSYDKQVSRIKYMRSRLEELEAEFDALLIQKTEELQLDSRDSSMLKSYRDLTERRAKLAAENWQLQRLNHRYMTIEGRFRSVWAVEAEPFLADLSFHFEPLPAIEYVKIIAEARDKVLRFLRTESKFTSGATVFGWRDQKNSEGGVLTFVLEKTFPLSSHELVERTWAIVSSTTEILKVYSPSLDVHVRMLQRVNDDTVVFYHTATMDGVTSKTIFVLARVNVEEGYLFVFRTIDRHRVAFELDAVNTVLEDLQSHQGNACRSMWYDKFVWILIRDVPDAPNRCSYHFGGNALNVKWLSEVLFITLRWEALAVEPIRLLGPQTVGDDSGGEVAAA